MYICIRKEAIKQPKKNLNNMKAQTFKAALFFTIILVTIITIHLLTPIQYK